MERTLSYHWTPEMDEALQRYCEAEYELFSGGIDPLEVSRAEEEKIHVLRREWQRLFWWENGTWHRDGVDPPPGIKIPTGAGKDQPTAFYTFEDGLKMERMIGPETQDKYWTEDPLHLGCMWASEVLDEKIPGIREWFLTMRVRPETRSLRDGEYEVEVVDGFMMRSDLVTQTKEGDRREGVLIAASAERAAAKAGAIREAEEAKERGR